ncbi:MAG: OmpA family protein [Cytophagaceae bacterium]|nr:OmpA family protein [Cytophagaceae bacterium]
MKSKSCLLIFFLVLGIGIQENTFAQKKGKKYTAKAVQFDTTPVKTSEYQFPFKNLNKSFYYNEEQIQLIRKHEEKKDLQKLLPVLEEYVKNFGIQNFYRNTNMIWRLGQLYELYGQKEKSKALFRLVLKHHRGKEIKKILQHYDTLDTDKASNYVPLEYYYELVEYRKNIDTLRPPHSVLLNMGELVNDKRFPDYGPTMHVQGDILIFTKRKKEITATKLSYRENEELYYSKNYDGFWDEALPFSNVINSGCNEGSACMSRDGKTLYFARCRVADYQFDCRDCMGACDIYVSHMQDDSVWSVPVNLGPNVNTTSWESQPTLSHNEDTLFFASDRIGGFGLSDIWYSYKTENGWAPAQNMGPVINTRANEVSPFYHPAHKVFYFSSNGQLLSFGDLDTLDFLYRTFDIYKSVFNTKGGFWQEPKNIGPLVNGKGDEYYFTIDSKSKDLFYARSEDSTIHNLDLFSFPLPMEAQPLANTKLKGSLKDSITGETFKGIVSIIDLSNGIEVAPKYIREDGTYEFDLVDNNDYLLVIQGEDFFRIEEKFHLDGDTTIDKEAPSIKYNKFKFQTLEFQPGKWDILPEMDADLDKVVSFLVDHPTFKCKISGHTDSKGDQLSNLELSQKRADAIKKYIVEKGYIDESRIEAVGFGSEKPIVAEEKTEDDRRINRRVEFELLKPAKEEEEKTEEENKEEENNNEEEKIEEETTD